MIEVRELFPTCIVIDENPILAQALLPLCNKYTEMSETNCLHIENFPSTLFDRELTQQVMAEPLVEEALSYIVTWVLPRLLNHRNIKSPTKLRPFGFFSSMEKYAYLRKHAHLDCSFSGLMYLEVGENVPDLLIHDPRPVTKFISYPMEQVTRTNELSHVIKPEPGMILLWESWLEHEVYQKMNDEPRKTFVFNL